MVSHTRDGTTVNSSADLVECRLSSLAYSVVGIRASLGSMVMHAVRTGKLGLPQETWEAFALPERDGWIEPDLSERMRTMVGSRNAAVHDYHKLRLEIVRSILEDHLNSFRALTAAMLSRPAGRT